MFNMQVIDLICIVLLFKSAHTTFAQKNDESSVAPLYTNYKHYTVHTKNKNEESAVKTFRLKGVNLIKGYNFNKNFNFFVSPQAESAFRDFFNKKGIEFIKKSDDVMQNPQKLMQPSSSSHKRKKKKNISNKGKFNFDYFTYEEISSYMDYLSKNFKNYVEVKTIGKTYENRSIFGVIVSVKKPKKKKPILLFDAGIHAREWLTPAMGLYILNQFVENETIRNNYLPFIDLAITPLLNPDGYVFSRTKDPFWRKNRHPTKACLGIDLNRNFDSKWAENKDTGCDFEIYPGTKAFSEAETTALRNFALSFPKNSIHLYVALHTYGDCLVHPWGLNETPPIDLADLMRCGKFVNSHLKNSYKVGQGSVLIPPATQGCSDDYFKLQGVKYAFTMEMSDGYEFHPPVSAIQKELYKAMPGIFGFADFIKKEYPLGKN